jgi:hypothetical protein
LSSPSKTFSSSPTLAGVAATHPFVGHKVSIPSALDRSPASSITKGASKTHPTATANTLCLFIPAPEPQSLRTTCDDSPLPALGA